MSGKKLAKVTNPKPVDRNVLSTSVEMVAVIRPQPATADTYADPPQKLPICSINANFPLGGDLPRATIVVPVGRRYGDSGDVVGENLVTQLTGQFFIEVWGKFSGRNHEGRLWPDAAVLLWAGMIANVSMVRSPTEVGIHITSVHWLAQLSSGSMLTQLFFPGDYMNLFAPSTVALSDVGGVPSTVSGLSFISRRASRGGSVQDSVPPTTFDLWWSVILPPMAGLLAPSLITDVSLSADLNSAQFVGVFDSLDPSGSAVQPNQTDRNCIGSVWSEFFRVNGGRSLGNSVALSVLTGAAYEPDLSNSATNDLLQDIYIGAGSPFNTPVVQAVADPFVLDLDGPLSEVELPGVSDPLTAVFGFTVNAYRLNNAKEMPPVSMSLPAGLNNSTKTTLSNSICDWVGAVLGDGLAYVSPLDKLHVLASGLMCKLAPNVRTAQLIPNLAPAVSTRAWRVLGPDDVLRISVPGWSGYSQQISGVALAQPAVPSQTGQTLGVTPGEFNAVFVGSPFGPLSVEPAPEWLKLALAQDNSVELQSVYGENLLVNRVFRRTAHARLTADVIANNATVADRLFDFQSIACNYCKARWADISYGPRVVDLELPFRLDIGPGSVLYVAGLNLGVAGSSAFESQQSADSGPIVGTVAGVGFSIDVATKTAGTVVSLSHVHGLRDEEQNLIPAFHPIYQSTVGAGGAASEWSGAPLARVFDSDMLPDQLIEVE